MAERVTRREFIDGIACAIVAGSAVSAPGHAQVSGSPYPPSRTGYGGGRPADFQVAHGVRDGRRYDLDKEPVAEHYDLIVVGAGIGGLATAHYMRKARPTARILILDNHDDFGGHARRNEFNVDGRFLLGYGGSESMEGPSTRWSAVARECVESLGVNFDRFETAFNVNLYPGLGLSSGLFFPREMFGEDKLITGDPMRSLPSDVPAKLHNGRPVPAFIADWPVDDEQKARLLALYTDTRDVLAGKSAQQKMKLLETTSYREYVMHYFGLDERSMAMFDGRTLDLSAFKSGSVPALDAWIGQYPGFQGLGLKMSREGIIEGDPYIHHFPDGNASLARLFVRELLPGVAAGHGMEDIVSAKFDYGKLDVPGNAVRLRLSSTAVAIANNPAGVDVLYAQGEKVTRVGANHVVYAGYSAMLPYICPEIVGAHRKALADQVRAPLVYVNVALRNWRAWVKQGIHSLNNPAGFYSNMKLDYPVSLGDYHCPTRPEEPIIVHLNHVPWIDGPVKDLRANLRAARAILYAQPFADFESHARDELTRILGPGGFDADRDIAAITVNRWGHGYAYTASPLYDDLAQGEREKSASIAPVGRIHFAGSDAAWMAYAHYAIDSAHRAAREITS